MLKEFCKLFSVCYAYLVHLDITFSSSEGHLGIWCFSIVKNTIPPCSFKHSLPWLLFVFINELV